MAVHRTPNFNLLSLVPSGKISNNKSRSKNESSPENEQQSELRCEVLFLAVEAAKFKSVRRMETVIHAFITSRLVNCNRLLPSVSQAAAAHLHLVLKCI